MTMGRVINGPPSDGQQVRNWQQIQKITFGVKYFVLAGAAFYLFRNIVGNFFKREEHSDLFQQARGRLDLYEGFNPCTYVIQGSLQLRAISILLNVPKALISSGNGEFFVFLNRMAGPYALLILSAISVISRNGSTSAATVFNSPAFFQGSNKFFQIFKGHRAPLIIIYLFQIFI